MTLQPVVVKPLVWEDLSGLVSEAASVAGNYRVKWDGKDYVLWLFGYGALGRYQTRTEGQEAGQEDFDARIRSALE